MPRAESGKVRFLLGGRFGARSVDQLGNRRCAPLDALYFFGGAAANAALPFTPTERTSLLSQHRVRTQRSVHDAPWAPTIRRILAGTGSSRGRGARATHDLTEVVEYGGRVAHF